jgi:mRNA-degrading endonuclease RelE of RelBE toxin-antitoxin system
MNKEIDEREERWGKVKWLKEKIIDIPKKVILGKIRKHPERCLIRYYILWIFIAIIGIVVYLKRPLEEPLPINYGMSWVILTLISMITLTYVQLINRLKDILISEQKEKRRIEASGMICMLVETLFLFFITILALVARIALLSFYEDLALLVFQISEGQEKIIVIEPISKKYLLIVIDYIMVSSLIVGSFMRFYIFLKSYVCKTTNYKSFMKKQYKISDKEDKWVPLGGIVPQKAFLLSKVAKEQFDSLPTEAENRVKKFLYYLNEPEKKQMLDIKKLKGVKLKGVDGKDLFRLIIEDYNLVYFEDVIEDVISFKLIQFRGKELAKWYC